MSVEVSAIERSAYHEAGHAVQAIAEGCKVLAITIESGMTGWALCSHSPVEGEGSAKAELRITVAAEVAESLARPVDQPVRADQTSDEDIYFSDTEIRLANAIDRQAVREGRPKLTDDEHAEEVLTAIEPADRDAEIALAKELAWRTLTLHEDLLHRLAAYLVVWRTLTAGDIQEILETEGAVA